MKQEQSHLELEELYSLYKPLLFSLAYKMLGSVMDAEDIVHETFIAFEKQNTSQSISNVKAYLCKMTTNRCIDLLRSAAHQRETYVGTWLPEPLVEDSVNDPANSFFLKESVSTAYLMLLQQLTEVERAVFLLREALQYDYAEIAEIVGKSSTNCRQIFHRAKKSIGQQPDVHVKENNAMGSFVETFVTAMQNGDVSAMMNLLQKDAIFYSDGGGKVQAALKPIYSADRITRLLMGIRSQHPEGTLFKFQQVNGTPGVVVEVNGYVGYVVSFEFVEGKINSIYMVVNPDKLRHLNK